ncbi:PAS domain-containing protein [Azospirillum rugosum]|uniref:Diguanylate cyclase (GGDEF)-like protein/PAS domain S-box-containing protein n=1 Tax=Azospirillum rugosum TaxID=416170 RepID=A0ABS4SS66_9PROT|nr:PAS domain-containing protein [Azospirillum rugosum]MBP2295069.1 diguanylate cyclase (GGDEF)-like protein/PAS domain S-box-containing protein [Azospirillum rugosum]MDQ0528892.1 diguanylate cyclase (GGDEF)-like protein/PAS domain S-box-containing protein [Azospirillum rugosum]
MPVWLFDSESARMVWANRAALDLWGASTLQEFLNRDFTDMSDATRTRLATLARQLAAGEPVIDQWTFYPNGQPVTARVRRTGMVLPDGRLGMLHEAVIIDQPVDPSTLRGVEALHHTSVKISLFTRDGTPLMRNPAAQKAFGPVGLGGEGDRLASHFLHEADRRALLDALDRGDTFSRFVEVVTRGGRKWHGVDARITTDPVSGALVVLMNERDVTEQVRAEQAVRASERRLARMVELLPAGAAYVEGEAVFLNRAAESITGYARDEVPSLDVWCRVAFPKDHEDIRRRYDAARASGAPVSVELPILRKDGALRWVLFSAVFAEHGEVWLLQDVTDHRAVTEALHRERVMLQSLIESMPDIVFFKDTDGTYLNCNRAALEYAGHPMERAMGRTDRDLFDADTAERRWRTDRLAMEKGFSRTEEWFTYPDGRRVLVETAKAACRDRDGTVLGVVGISRDITERRQSEDQLKRQRALLQGIIDAIPDAVFFKDRDGVLRKVNRAFAAWQGKTPDAMVGTLCHEHWPAELVEDIRRTDAAVYAEDRPCRNEEFVPQPDGSTLCVEMLKAPIRDDGGELLGLVGIGRDITERKAAEERLRRSEAEKDHLAHHDALTGLPNRRLFFDRLTTALARADRSQGTVALLFIDLDKFKAVNDTLGHSAGDVVLRVSADRIVTCLRKADTVARMGGDEFAAILEQVHGEDDARAVADKIVEALAHPIRIADQDVHVGASIGVALYPQHARDAGALLAAADTAMYTAKQPDRHEHVILFSPTR